MNFSPGNVETAVYMLVGLVIGVIFHEVMHGYAAYRSGDTTAKNAGRLTLDPVAHVDPFGTLILPGVLLLLNVLGMNSFIIGYAKPVPINPFAFRKRSAIIWVSLAGPLTNLLIAVIFLAAAKVAYEAGGDNGVFNSLAVLRMIYAFTYIAYINSILFVFNLIPIPPLDGSRVVGYYLKGQARDFYRSIEPYGILVLLVFLSIFSVAFTSIVNGFFNFLASLVGL